jgi:hypothetical protein
MFKIALILAISAICFAADALPASTVSAVKAYDAEMAKAKAEYDRKDDAAKKVLVAALTKAQAAEMKANNLEGALAIKKKIEELTPKTGDLLGDDLNYQKFVGTWATPSNDIWKVTSDAISNGKDVGTWKVEGAVIVIKWEKWSGKNDVQLPINGKQIKVLTESGSFMITRKD